MKNYVQSGEFLEITAGAAYSAGDLVEFGSLHGVAVADIANGANGIICMEGVFTLPKLTAASGDACTAGGPVYFSSGSVSGPAATTCWPVPSTGISVASQLSGAPFLVRRFWRRTRSWFQMAM